jgi:hypothetical protein
LKKIDETRIKFLEEEAKRLSQATGEDTYIVMDEETGGMYVVTESDLIPHKEH